MSQRVATDKTFRCIDEATVYAGAKSGAFKSAYYYTIERTYAGYDPNGLGFGGLSSGPIEPGYPYGDPNLPYFRLHGSDLGFTYGNQNPLRDADDLKAAQLISGYFAQFAKTGDPNPSLEYLKVRGYVNVSSTFVCGSLRYGSGANVPQTTKGVKESGPWEEIRGKTGPTKALDYPAPTVEFPDMQQCLFLNYSISYYLEGGSYTRFDSQLYYSLKD